MASYRPDALTLYPGERPSSRQMPAAGYTILGAPDADQAALLLARASLALADAARGATPAKLAALLAAWSP